MSDALNERMAKVGGALAERERAHGDDLKRAREKAASLQRQVAQALDGYRSAVEAGGASHLTDVAITDARLDDKHVRAVEFALSRGRYRAIVTVKSKGEVTLVGPFRTGKTEGPCKSFPFDAEAELQAALGDFLTEFLEEAATP